MVNRLTNQLIAVKLNGISILMIDLLPQCLELSSCKVIIQRIIFHLCLVTIGKHILENTVIINGLNQGMNTFCHWLDFFRQRSNSSHLHIGTILVCNLTLHIHITIADQIELNGICCVFVNKRRCSIHLNIFTIKVFTACRSRSIIEDCFNITLEIGNKAFIAFTGNNRQHIDVMNTVTAAFCIHTVTMLVYTKTQTTTNFLTLRCLAVRMFQRTNLENIRVIPTFTQCGVPHFS